MERNELEDVKRQVAIGNRVLAEVGLGKGIMASLGHVSMRLPSDPDRFVVKGRGYALDALETVRPEDMVVCNLEGEWLEGPDGTTPCAEVKMHSCIFKLRPDVQSVVHAHPKFTIVMSVLQVPLVPMSQQGATLVQQPLPVFPHVRTIHSDEEGMETAQLLGESRGIILRGHGASTAGKSPSEALQAMVALEWQAELNWYAYCAEGRDHKRISDQEISEMVNRPGVMTMPHFQSAVERGGQLRTDGFWSYYTHLVSKDL